jgi:phospholipid-transporting ATPase
MGIRLIHRESKNIKNLQKAADFTIENFRQLDRLVFYFGFNCYMKMSKLICYYFYKNMILVFVELWFNIYCGFSSQQFFLGSLIMMYNAVLTTFQCFIALYSEKRHSSNKNLDLLQAHFYYEGITNKHFNYRVFWQWVIASILHGAAIFFMVTQLLKHDRKGDELSLS